ncbi:5604_t:CDS:2, partial [Racocetra persica]
MSLSLPSTSNFESHEALINHVQTYALRHGYAVSIKRSEREKFVYLQCDRGSYYINRLNLTDETHQRATSTRLIDCPFELYGKKMKDSQWHLTIKNKRHNHEASQDISGHLSSCRLNEEDQQRVREMSTAGVRPREILSTLRQDDLGKLAILKTIYNARDKIHRDNLQGRTPIQALLDELVEENFEHNYQCDQNDNLTHLFFAYSKSIALNRVAHIFGNVPKPKVIITDRELALMHAVYTVFSESQNVLYVWYIEKNVLTSCKRHFQINDEWIEFMECWSNLIKSQTEADFDSNWEGL